MTRIVLVLGLWLLASLPAFAQNPTCPTRPPGDSSNACASTAFVSEATAGAGILRSEIPSRNLNGGSVFTSGCTVAGDTGTGIQYILGTADGANAIQDATGQWYEAVTNGSARPEIWCAAGDGVTDDTAALNSTFDWYRSVPDSGGKNPVGLIGVSFREGANYLITGPINMHDLTNANFVLFGNGAAITCKSAGDVCLDAIASSSMTWQDLTIRGDEDDRPSIGVQFGRETQDAARPTNVMNNISVIGYFTKASVINAASENSQWSGSITNRDAHRNSYAYVLDANNTMDLGTSFPVTSTQLNGPWRGLIMTAQSGGNWVNNRYIKGATTGAVGKVQGRNTDNLYVALEAVTGGVGADLFAAGEVVNECTTLANCATNTFDGRTATITTVTYWARRVGDSQSAAGVDIKGDFRKSDSLANQLGTGWAVRLVGQVGGDGTIKEFRMDGYTAVLDSSGIKMDADCYNCEFITHGETQQMVGKTPSATVVVVDGSGNPITSFVTSRTLTGGTSGTVGTITGYNDDQVLVTVTPSTAALTGTVTVNNGSAALVGSGTLFLTELARATPITITDTGEVYTVLNVTSDTAATLTELVIDSAVGSAATKATGKFLFGETVTESVSGATGTVDSGFGPVAGIDVTSTSAVWLENFKYVDHNPHAWVAVIQKRGTTLSMRDAVLDVRATNWDVPLFHNSGGGFGNIDFHGQLWIGDGGAQETTALKNLSNARRVDGEIYLKALGSGVTLPTNGDVCIFGLPVSSGDPALSYCRTSGKSVGDFNYRAVADLASATTTDLGANVGNRIRITGTTTITGFGTAAAGTYRSVRMQGILILTHNATSLILPNGGSNITTAADDEFVAISLGSGNWKVISYTRASGGLIAVPVTVPQGGTGLTTAAQGDLLYGSAANVYSRLTKNTSATRYLANTGTDNNPNWDVVNMGTGVTGTLSIVNGGTGKGAFGYSLHQVLVFTASTTYTPDTNVQAIYAECVGSGGGGGYAEGVANQTGAGGGGGGGSYASVWVVSLAANYTLTINAGGTGGDGSVPTAATDGGTVTLGAILACNGGTAGTGDASSATPHTILGGAGGSISGTTGDYKSGGIPGLPGIAVGTGAAVAGVSGAGGNTYMGGGAAIGRVTAANGQAATANTGGGGSGGLSLAATDRNGGNGATGVIRIWEYY